MIEIKIQKYKILTDFNTTGDCLLITDLSLHPLNRWFFVRKWLCCWFKFMQNTLGPKRSGTGSPTIEFCCCIE